MDLPSYHHHHHHRYVERPPNVSHNPNVFRHLPPPPPPPQRRPPPLPHITNIPHHHHHIPPPSPPFHRQSQFSFPPHSPPQENPKFFDCRSPPRVSSNLILDQSPYHPAHPQQQNFHYNDRYHNPHPPNSPRFIVDDFMRENRLRGVEFDYDDDERYRLERRRMEEHIDVREFRSSAENYELHHDDRYEGKRWEYGHNVDDGILVGSSSRRVSLDNSGYDYGGGDVRFSNRLRVDKEEIYRSPPQKKSALLRIQCGNANNNRSSRNQDNDSSSIGGCRVRGKQKDVFERLERRVEGRDGSEGSSMELDVSFKSNALVAKAIMAPVSSPTNDSDRSETPRCKKIRKVNLSDSPMKKVGYDLGKGDGSAIDSGRCSSSNKESKCLADKVTVSAGRTSNSTLDSNMESKHLADKIKDSSGGRASDGTLNSNKESKCLLDKVTVPVVRSALLSSNGTNDLIVTQESKGSPEIMILDQGGNHVGKGGAPQRKIRKKKKVTKKKVTAPKIVGVNPCNATDSLNKASFVRQQLKSVVKLVERTRSDDMTRLEDVNMKKVKKKKVMTPKNSGVDLGNATDSLNKASFVRQQLKSVVELVEKTRSDDMTTLEDVNMNKAMKKNVTAPKKVGVDPDNATDLLNKACSVRQQLKSVVELVERTRSDDMTTLEDVSVKPPVDEVVSKLGKPSKLAAVSEDESVEQSNSDGKKADPAKVLVSSSSVDSEINDFADCTSRSVLSGPSMLNSETCMIEVQNKPTSSTVDNADNVGGHSQDERRVSEDGLIKEPSAAMVCVERNGDVVLSSLDGSTTHKDEVSSSTKDTYISSVSDLGFSDGKENAVAVIGLLEASSVVPSSDPKIVPLLTNIERGLKESFLDGNDCSFNSSEAGRVAVVSELLSAECSSNRDPTAGSFVCSMKKSCVDGVTLSPEMSHTKGSVNAVVSVGDDIRIIADDDCLPNVTRKRKITEDESVLPTTKVSETEENTVSSLLGQGKSFSCLRGDHASIEEEVTVPGNGSDSLKGDPSHEGPSEVELLLQDCFNDGSSSCSIESPKKREVSSPGLVKSASCVTTHEGASSIPITVPLIDEVSVTELESRNTLSDLDDGPPSRPSVILLESSTAEEDVSQAEPFEDGLMDRFSDVEQVIAHNSQLGAAGLETTTSVISVGMLRMAYGISEDKGSSIGVDQKLASEDCESHNYVLDKACLPLLANNHSLFSDSNCVSAMKVSAKGMESVPDMSALVSFPEDLPNNSFLEETNAKSSMSNEIVIEKAQNVDENSITADDHVSSSAKTSSDSSEFGNTSSDTSRFGRSSDHKVGGVPLVNLNTVPLSSQNTVKSTQNVTSLSWKPNLRANQQSPAVPRVLSVHPSNFLTSRNVPTSKKPLTWHRTGNSSFSVVGRGSQMNSLPPQSHLPKDIGKAGSYIRKGNSLVRKPPPVGSLSQGFHAPSSSLYRLNSSAVNNLKRKPENKTLITDSPSCRGTPEVNAPSERTKTLPQSEPFSCITLKSASFPVVDHPGTGSIATSNPLAVTDNMLALKPSEDPSTSSALPECQIGLGGNSKSQNILDEGSSGKEIVYVKQRSNQLVAASDKTQASSDGYYKRRKNQLIRACSSNHMKQRVAAAKNVVPTRRGLAKTSKWSKSSLVWKLGDTQSSRKCGSAVEYEKLWPYLFPWKRASYRRSFQNSSPSDSSISIIRRKMLLSRKRETIYTRSIHGLSLRRSKVLSVSGSSLKWSKSMEQRSKKAAEEAALAVAAVDKRKRGQDDSNADSMNGNNVSRERIFRIGCERYKMDPSGKTLQRISGDEEPSVSVVPEAKKSYIPKRLLIGNDEYVRVGNGNKLVRNPKRRVRMLASEKVRWSLHTARIRLARKKQYCQFFTRFGKCNKDNGKCPYIHDPSKIAVCTKFLNGSCSDTNCKLTHEVLPERMQDCSYFLQGICSNENCPYRHVNVNSNASICEGFLRGYCADGNECRKKHTYVCPVFEATGNCPQGSKCKLHHPKNKRKGVKRKASSEMKNGRGRYFGSPHIDSSERITAGLEKTSVRGKDDIFLKKGKFVDFISLDGSDEEELTIDQRSEEPPLCESGSAEMQLDDLDELIKPMKLINRNRSVDSSPFIDSPSDMAASYVSEESQCCK
uniref:Uncharacterized protein LOC104232248 isoform X3 n=1 Tax=Nicotiana sylvestris TaxID=4096 RepID=A0A1U7X9U4_NICSY|nr:PREDICTED: uncharacterized protein LOC104232248 isoform X3 [Nicotiana sylvestris]